MAWELLTNTLLTDTSSTLTSESFDAKENLLIQFYKVGANVNPLMTFNGDTSGSNYASRYSSNGASDVTLVNQTKIEFVRAGSTPTSYAIISISNISDKEKMVIIQDMEETSSGSGTAPAIMQVVGKWVNTSASITSVSFANDDSGSYGAGSFINVYGTD